MNAGAITRERGKTAVIDTGKMWAQRGGTTSDTLDAILGLTPQKMEQAFRLLWFKGEE
jgi:hypothetical protein